MPGQKILITGCGRSGTRYISELLTAMGLPVGHEEMSTFGTAAWHLAVDSESPVAYRSLRKRDHSFDIIVHQVRAPLAVIGSMRTAEKASWDYIERFIPVSAQDPLILKCMKYWYYWNLEAEKSARWTYRIEALPDIFDVFCHKIGHPEFAEKKEVLEVMNTDINTRKGRYRSLGDVIWEILGRTDEVLCLKIKGLAEKYGY